MMLVQDGLRTAVVAAAALACAYLIRPTVAKRQRWTWALVLAPYLTPPLLVGYAYSNFSLSLVHHPTLNALWYATLLVLRLAPVAALTLMFAPHPLSEQRYTAGGWLAAAWTGDFGGRPVVPARRSRPLSSSSYSRSASSKWRR